MWEWFVDNSVWILIGASVLVILLLFFNEKAAGVRHFGTVTSGSVVCRKKDTERQGKGSREEVERPIQ